MKEIENEIVEDFALFDDWAERLIMPRENSKLAIKKTLFML